MKKRISALLLGLCLILLFPATVFAASGANFAHVTDNAGLLTDSEAQQLEAMAEEVSSQYGVGIYLMTIDDFRDYDTRGVFEATYGIYHANSLGEGTARNGILLLLSMDDRDYALFCYGNKSEYAFNDYAQKRLEQVFLDDFADNNWVQGFEDYINQCATFLSFAEAGDPVHESPLGLIAVFIVVAIVIALAVCAVFWMQMVSARKKMTADDYVVGNLQLSFASDQFTHSTQTRRRIESETSSGSSSHSGGGGSGRSGKF